MPRWMMTSLGVPDDTRLNVKNVSLPKATFVKFQAQVRARFVLTADDLE